MNVNGSGSGGRGPLSVCPPTVALAGQAELVFEFSSLMSHHGVYDFTAGSGTSFPLTLLLSWRLLQMMLVFSYNRLVAPPTEEQVDDSEDRS